MVLASFIISWLAGISPLTGIPRPWFDVFFWAGWVLFILLSINIIQALAQRTEQVHTKKQFSFWNRLLVEVKHLPHNSF